VNKWETIRYIGWLSTKIGIVAWSYELVPEISMNAPQISSELLFENKLELRHHLED